MTKFTKTSLKKFIRENKDGLLVKQRSEFNGMIDCVDNIEGAKFEPATPTDRNIENTLGIQGLWLVGSSRDYFEVKEENGFKIVEVYNCCGSTELAARI